MFDVFRRSAVHHWYDDRRRLNREVDALRSMSLGNELEFDEEERCVVRDEPFAGVELEVVFPPAYPIEPPRIYIQAFDYPVALLALIQDAGYVTPEMEVRYTRLHRWSARYTAAVALSSARDILTIATRLLPATELPPDGETDVDVRAMIDGEPEENAEATGEHRQTGASPDARGRLA